MWELEEWCLNGSKERDIYKSHYLLCNNDNSFNLEIKRSIPIGGDFVALLPCFILVIFVIF